jgi:hypothetical protein
LISKTTELISRNRLPFICLARDKIYTGVRREPDGGKLSSAVDGPDVCHQQAKQTKFPKVARRLPSTGPTFAVNGPDVCRQRARQTNSSNVCCQRARRLPSTGPMSAVNRPDKQTQAISTVDKPDICCQLVQRLG